MRMKILALLFLVCCAQHVAAQPSQSDSETQTQQANVQPSPTPVDNRQAEIDNAAKAERERYEKERDAKEEAFKAEQLNQNGIIVTATVFAAVVAGINLLVAVVYALFAYRTLKAVDKQANHASEQVGVTRDQLTAMDRERRVLHTHAGAMFATARYTKQMLNETHNLVLQNAEAVDAMQGQLVTMKAQVAVASKQTDLTSKQIDLLVLNECAYVRAGDFAIPAIRNYELIINGKFFNGGRTPAWDFTRRLGVILAEQAPPHHWTFDWEDPSADFPPSASVLIVAQDSVNFSTEPFKITHEMFEKINAGDLVITVVGECRYLDSLGGRQIYDFAVVMEINPPMQPKAVIHYQHHRREQANPN